MARDFYEVLGVPRTADRDEIQRAYRTLARRHHPDVNKDPQAEERFKEINEAFSVLSDPKQRARYDRFGEDFRKIPEDWEERVAAGAGAGSGFRGTTGGGPRVRYSTAGFGGEGVDVEDLFGSLFGAAGRMARARRRPGGRTAAHRRGGLSGRPPYGHPRRAGRAAALPGRRAAWHHRRAAHPADRGGRRGAAATLPPGTCT